MLKNLILTGCGGALGAMLRLVLAKVFPSHVSLMPTYILMVNAFGCFLLGLMTEFFTLKGHFPATWRYFLLTGFLGGLTTFSAYVLEMGLMMDKHQYALFFIYTCGSVVTAYFSFFIASHLIRWMTI